MEQLSPSRNFSTSDLGRPSRPVVVVGQAAQAGLNAANENGYILVGLPDEIAVDDGGVVRALAHDAAGSEGVRLPAVPGDGIVVDHGVHVAGAHQEGQARLAQGGG